MNRFCADAARDRQLLFVDAIRAHRERDSPFLTVEVEPDELGPRWLQFADGVVNLDCTDEELDRLKALLDSFPAFKIDELTRPEDAEGTNARVTAFADQKRIAEFIDRALGTVYDLPADYRAWVTAV